MSAHVCSFTIPDLAPAYRCACGQRAVRITRGFNKGRWHKLGVELEYWPDTTPGSTTAYNPDSTPAVDTVVAGRRKAT